MTFRQPIVQTSPVYWPFPAGNIGKFLNLLLQATNAEGPDFGATVDETDAKQAGSTLLLQGHAARMASYFNNPNPADTDADVGVGDDFSVGVFDYTSLTARSAMGAKAHIADLGVDLVIGSDPLDTIGFYGKTPRVVRPVLPADTLANLLVALRALGMIQ